MSLMRQLDRYVLASWIRLFVLTALYSALRGPIGAPNGEEGSA